MATRRGKTRGACPRCRTPVWLTPEEIGRPLSCNVCLAEFSVERRRRKRSLPPVPAVSPFARRRERALRGLFYVIGVILIVLGFLLGLSIDWMFGSG